MSEGLQEGQRAILRLGTANRMYAVRIEEVRDEVLIMSAPIRLGHVVAVKPGTQVEVQYHRHQTMFGFQATVLDFRPGHLPLVTVTRPVEIRKVQRREYVRWPVSLPVTVVPAAGAGEVKGRVVDLSGGGLAADLPGEWEEGQEVHLHLHLQPDPPEICVEAEARIVRAWRTEAQQGAVPGPGLRRPARVAFEFTRIAPAVRERIIRYIFARQREFLRLGLAGRDRGAGS